MRRKKSIKNMIISLIVNFIIIFIGFIAQKYYIICLGDEYLGINGLFSSIISMLAIAELGVGSAIIYNLYKPIANNELNTIKSLMYYYKTSYRKIALIITILGLLLIPFLPLLVGDVSIHDNIYIIYMLFLFDTSISYLLIYKRALLDASQNNYIYQLIHITFVIILNFTQILILVVTKNYYLYLIVKIVFRFLENFTISILVDKLFPYIKDKEVLPLSEEIKADIKSKIKAILFHKIGGYAILGSDNIMISLLINVKSVGLYSNYRLIINAIQTIFSQAFISISGSVGNLLVDNEADHFAVYERLEFLNFWLSTFTSCCLLIIIDSFITIWIGNEYVLPISILFVLVINYYLQTMRSSLGVFKEAAGIFHEDRFVPFIELIANIILSVLFTKLFGFIGIFIGTFFSNLIIHFYSYPKFVYTRLFKKSYLTYYVTILKYFLISFFICALSFWLSRLLNSNELNVFINFLLNCLYSLIFPNILLLLIFYKNKCFKYFVNLLKDYYYNLRKRVVRK